MVFTEINSNTEYELDIIGMQEKVPEKKNLDEMSGAMISTIYKKDPTGQDSVAAQVFCICDVLSPIKV